MKSKVIYKLISTLTLVLPLPIYLILSATIFNIKPDYTIQNVEIANLSVFSKDDEYFIVSDNKDAIFYGTMAYDVDLDTYVLVIEEDDIIKVGRDFYSYDLEKGELIDIKKFELEKQQSYKIPLSVIISLGAVLIVVLVIQKKMDVYKKYPRTATFVALLTGTIVLYIMNTIVGNILNVFMIATTSWGAYCLEYMIYTGTAKSKTDAKKENDIIGALKKALEE